MNDREPRFEYVDDPVNFRAMVKKIGVNKTAELLGYVPNSIYQLYEGRRRVRQFVEFAAEQWLLNQEKEHSKDKLYIFATNPDSEGFTVLSGVAKTYNIKITEL